MTSHARSAIYDAAFYFLVMATFILIGLFGLVCVLPAHAAEAVTTATTVDISPTLAILAQYGGSLLAWGIPVLLAFVGQKLPLIAPLIQFAVSTTHATDNQVLETYIKHGLTQIVGAATKAGTVVDVRNGLAAQVALWVQDQMPARLARLGLSPEVLVARVEAIAASHLQAAAPQTVVSDVAPPAALTKPAISSDVPKGI